MGRVQYVNVPYDPVEDFIFTGDASKWPSGVYTNARRDAVVVVGQDGAFVMCEGCLVGQCNADHPTTTRWRKVPSFTRVTITL